MRAHEFIVENVITHGDNQFKIERLEPGDEEYADMKVSVLDDWGNVAGFAKFASDGKDLDPRALKVHDRYRGQGFAKLIYDFMKSKGYRIIRSWDQTDDGAHFWDKNRGEDVRVWEDRGQGVDADQVLDYVKRTHAPEEFDIEYSITDHPRWELKNIPLSQLKLDPDGEERDPYNRVNWVDYDTVSELIPRIGAVLKSKPIVVDSQGWIIDGNHRATAAAEAGLTSVPAYVPADVNEGVPQPGQSSGAPTEFAPGTKIQTRPMTARQIISSIPGVPYYNNVVDDWDAKDFSWGVTKKVIEYAEYLKQHPESLAKLPPIQVVNGQFKDGAHRVSAVWLLQQRMDPRNPLWKNAKLNVQFAQQDVNESAGNTQWLYHATYRPLLKSIKQHGLGGDRAQAKWEDSKPGVVYLATDPNIAESYAESSDAVPEEWLDQIIVLKINAGQLDQSRLFVDQNVQDNTGDTLEYHGVIPVGSLSLLENFADGKVKGKSRPGRVKRAGASCAGSVTDLRAKARKYGGERGKMYHWCANMKGGRNK